MCIPLHRSKIRISANFAIFRNFSRFLWFFSKFHRFSTQIWSKFLGFQRIFNFCKIWQILKNFWRILTKSSSKVRQKFVKFWRINSSVCHFCWRTPTFFVPLKKKPRLCAALFPGARRRPGHALAAQRGRLRGGETLSCGKLGVRHQKWQTDELIRQFFDELLTNSDELFVKIRQNLPK